MQFSLEDFTHKITIPYLLGEQELEETYLKKMRNGDFEGMSDQTENDDAFEFPILDGQTLL